MAIQVRMCIFGFFILLISCSVSLATKEPVTPYDKLYDLGMNAYRMKKWSKCSFFFQAAIDDYHTYKDALINCRLKCKGKDKLDIDISQENLETAFFGNLIESSNCLRRCKRKELGVRPEVLIPSVMERKFESRVPYNYLHFCLYKLEKYNKKMAAASYTYFIINQKDPQIMESLQFYRTLPDLTDADFVDLERKPYQQVYANAIVAYDKGDWAKAADEFEESLSMYYEEEERCRAGCEDGYIHSGYPDFINAVTDHYVVVLICQRKCEERLSVFGMETIDNFVGEHYNYLQFSYYNLKNYDAAVRAVASFLVFQPSNQEMLNNKRYFKSDLSFHEGHFTPHEAAVEYVTYRNLTGRILQEIREKYILPNDKTIMNEKDEEEEEEEDEEEEEGEEKNPRHYMSRFAKHGIRLFAESEQLSGPLRFAADKFFREDQCLGIAELVQGQAVDFMGVRKISVPEMVDLVKSDGDYEMSLRLMLRAVEIVRHYTSAYFNQSTLFVTNVKVICREGGDKWEKDMPADCTPQEDGTCLTELSPSKEGTTEYTSVAYLTDIEDGTGQIYFLDENKSVQSNVMPNCGRLVGFAKSNLHGVNLSWKESRCSLLVQTTTDRSKDDTTLRQAGKMLVTLDENRIVSNVNNTDILLEFQRQGVHISMTGADLKGKERFAADGLSSEQECQELIAMANTGAISGDGYQPGHVHRAGEEFSGLRILQAAELAREGMLTTHSVQQLLDLSDQSRLLVEKYFNLSRPLYFDFTHLVCRTAKDGVEEEDDLDLSHPVHSDNCMIQPDGTCIRDAMTFTQRHYSAVLYLNSDFDGGEFFFTDRELKEQSSVKPKCGRLVAFNSGEYHGVKAVRKGQRCAVAMWYTLDPNHQEIARIQAIRALHKLQPDFSQEAEVHKTSHKMDSAFDATAEDGGEDIDLSSLEESHDEL